MAALTSAAVSPYPTDIPGSEWPRDKGDRSVYTRRVKVVLSAQGTVANPIPASAFGFSKLLNCSALLDVSNGKVIPAVVDPSANIIMLGGGAAGVFADVTAAVSYITVTGVL